MTQFMLIERIIKDQIVKSLAANKVIVLLGPRRVGKTVLINQVIKNIKEPYMLLSGEDFTTLSLLERRSIQNYKSILGEIRMLIIDEAQKIPDIGNKLKIMVDHIEGLKILIIGSSAFDISNNVGEPLTGRKLTYNLYALSEQEFNQVENNIEKRDNIRTRLIYGNYPELLQKSGDVDRAEYLREVINSYLLKDILTFEGIKNSDKIFRLLRLIAFQIGGEVSLGRSCDLSKKK